MTADQITNIIEGLIPLALGFYGLAVSRTKTKLKPGLTKYLRPLSILSLGIGIFFILKSFFTGDRGNVNYLDVAMKINESVAGTYVDEVTRIDSVTIGGHNEFIYHYSVLNIKSTEVNYDSIGTFENAIRDSMYKNPNLGKLLRYGNPVIFKYFGADGALITEIKIEGNN